MKDLLWVHDLDEEERLRSGLYKATFQTRTGGGVGLLYLNDGKVHGGDLMMFYVGTYTLCGDEIEARVKIDKHSNVPGMESVFGRERNTIRLSGTFEEHKAELEGRADQASGVSFKVSLEWLSD